MDDIHCSLTCRQTVYVTTVCRIRPGWEDRSKGAEVHCIPYWSTTAGNILINKRESCHCPNIFKCDCPLKSKCEIRIADFDSIKTFIPGRSATLIPDSPSEPKPAGTKVLGTPFYRAPEVSKLKCFCATVYVYTCIVGLHVPILKCCLCMLLHQAINRNRCQFTSIYVHF